MNLYIFVCVFAVLISAIAQMLLKKSAKQQHKSWIFEYLNVYVVLGYGILMGAMLLNIFAMHNGVELKSLSAVGALGYLFVPTLSYFVFKEKVSKRKILAIALIIVGVVVFFM